MGNLGYHSGRLPLRRVHVDTLLDILGRISPGHLFEEPRPVVSSVYLVLAAIFAVVFVVGLVFALRPNLLAHGNRLVRRLTALYATWYAWLGGIGLVVIGLRYMSVSLLSKRIWTVLDVLAILAVTGHLLYYRLRRYPDDLADYLEEERRRRFIPQPRRSAGGRRRGVRRR